MTDFGAEFGRGFQAPWRGLAALARTPRWLALALAPAVIALVLLIGALLWASLHLFDIVRQVLVYLALSPLGEHGFWLGVAAVLTWLAFIPALGLVVFMVARLLAAPFNSLLAERALHKFGSPVDAASTPAAFVRRLLRMALVSLAQELILVVCGIALFLVSLLPLVNALALAGYFVLAAFDCVSYALDAQGRGLGARLRYFRARFPAFLGFALAFALLLTVPLLNLFAYPIAVAGGAWLVASEAGRN
jgi:uncharacterized protein involved in cysteine biosynthesis